MKYPEEVVPPPPDDETPVSQAERVLRKFGGAARLTRLLKQAERPYNMSSVYRWTYPKSLGGTGGVIPSQAWPDIFYVARLEGLVITAEDLDPRRIFMDRKRILAFPPIVRKRKGKAEIE